MLIPFILAITRTLGDQCAKRLGVICRPEVFDLHLDSSKDRVLILACDGVWDALSNQEVVDLCLSPQNGVFPGGAQRASDLLMERSLKGLDAKQLDDNVTNIVLFFEWKDSDFE